MKKIVPFQKEIIFKSNISEITSISLEHTLHYEDGSLITGDFIVSGDYKMTETSINTEHFLYNLPFDINMDEKYVLDKVVVDIDDFYYEIINSNVLSVHIDVLIDKLEEKPLIIPNPMEEVLEEVELVREEMPEVEDVGEIEEAQIMVEKGADKMEAKEEKETVEEVKSLFDNMIEEEEFSTYHVYMVREGDTIEGILTKYSITREELSFYNDLNEVKMGDKLIIPSIHAIS